MKVAVLGMGYVGCVTAACLADAGHMVVGIDPAPHKYEPIARGETPIVEPGLSELLAKSHASGRISATSEMFALRTVDIAIVCVGTPSLPTGELDLKYVKSVARDIGAELKHRSSPLSIMLRSTVLPGTTSDLFVPWIEEAAGLKEGEDFYVSFCPEFLREATAIADFYNPPFTVVGADSPGAAEVATELLSFIGVPVQVVASGVAEGLKYSCNAFHALKVAFANEIARVCIERNVDAREVMNLFVQDRELNISHRYLRPGFAFGGSCLPKDVRALQYLSEVTGVDAPLLNSLTETNEAHIKRVVDMVTSSGITSVAQVGLTFKPATDDLRESPFLKLISALRQNGVRVRAYDPIIKLDRLVGANKAYLEEHLPGVESVLVDDLSEALESSELVLLGTNAADVTDGILAGKPVPVIDLSGSLPPGVEQSLRQRETVTPIGASYLGAAW